MKRLVRTFKVLSDETRLRILHLLIEAGELCVCDMESVLGCPQTRVSRHLAILRDAGWIEDRRQGLWIFYSLTKSTDPVHRSALKTLKEIVSSAEEFIVDKKKLRQALSRGQCKTYQGLTPEELPEHPVR